MNVTGEGGKGSARRKGANDQAYKDNFDRIFNKVKCPECGSADVELEQEESHHMMPEWERGFCHDCDHEWNEDARDA